MQKLMFKGLMKDDKTLRELKVANGAKLMLVGSTITAVMEVTKPVTKLTAEKEAEGMCTPVSFLFPQGVSLLKDSKILRELKVANGAKLMLVGSKITAVMEVTKPITKLKAEKEAEGMCTCVSIIFSQGVNLMKDSKTLRELIVANG